MLLTLILPDSDWVWYCVTMLLTVIFSGVRDQLVQSCQMKQHPVREGVENLFFCGIPLRIFAFSLSPMSLRIAIATSIYLQLTEINTTHAIQRESRHSAQLTQFVGAFPRPWCEISLTKIIGKALECLMSWCPLLLQLILIIQQFHNNQLVAGKNQHGTFLTNPIDSTFFCTVHTCQQ